MSFTEIIVANNAGSTLAAPIDAVQTSVTLASGTGVLFPSPTGSQYFVVTVVNGSGVLREIMKCTSRTGDVLTVVRAQEGTPAHAYNIFDPVNHLWTAGQFQQMIQAFRASDTLGGFSAIQPYAGNPTSNVAGNAANGSIPPSMCWDSTDGVLWVCTVTGSTSTAVWVPIGQSAGVLWCGTSTGSANAQILTPSPALAAYSAGRALSFIAGFTNTGALTVNVSGLGARNVFKDSSTGPVALTGGEVVVGNILTMRDDGTRFQLTATELGTAALANASSNTGTVAAVSGATVVGHVPIFSDTFGTLQEGPAPSSVTPTLVAVSGATVVGHIPVFIDTAGTVGDGGLPGAAAAPTYISHANNGTTLGPGVYSADTTAGAGGAFSITLPASPTTGQSLTFMDAFGTWGTANLTLTRNGHTIMGLTQDMICNVTGLVYIIEYNGTDWRLG